MMTRGTVAASIVLAMAGYAAAAEQAPAVFELRTYYAAPGRLDDLQARFRDHTIKLFEKHGLTNIGYWTPIDNPDGKLIYMLAFAGQEARDKAWKSFFADPQWEQVKKESQANGRLVTKVESVLLAATDYSPATKPSVAGPRVFELRTYTATPGNLGHLNARFRDHTKDLFKKHGITSIGYWCPLEGQTGAGETLIYMLSHESVEAAAACFDAFRKDPDWIAARKASEETAGGPLTVKDGVKSLFLNATEYSPTR
jgi:hypothetical protein